MRQEKKIVQTFYETFGWVRNDRGNYNDTEAFVDRRPVLASYDRRVHRRIQACLKADGRFFLDAGSGPLPNPEDLNYSARYGRRVCVDFSRAALVGARDVLGDRGFYVLADVTMLPFVDCAFAASLAAHVLYHLPPDEQVKAVTELTRTLAPGCVGVILYRCRRSLLSRLGATWGRLRTNRPALSSRGLAAAGNCQTREVDRVTRPPLFSYAHRAGWFARCLRARDDFEIEVRVWRTADWQFTRAVVPDGVIGRLIMSTIGTLETLFPRAILWLGGFPMIVIRKRESRAHHCAAE